VSAREEVAAASRTLAEHGLLIGTAGNVSVRDGDHVHVTATGVRLAECTPDDVTTVTLAGEVVDGRLTPTSELGLHLRVYDATDARAIVHTHAPVATAMASVHEVTELPVLHYQQLALGGTVRVADYATFGTPELADAVVAALDGRQAALMANHGSVTLGGSLAQAVDNALLLEWVATLHQRASTVGTPRALTDDQQQAVIAQAIALRYGTTQENP
jgi:L-fuculose-phosphate aldolase